MAVSHHSFRVGDLSGWVGCELGSRRPSHGAAGTRVPGTPTSSVCFSAPKVGIDSGGLQLQMETEFNMRREQLVQGEGKSEKRPGGAGTPKLPGAAAFCCFPSLTSA